ncbi:MAG: hypothetical protein IKV26_03460 [Paludibacteraceae bacterium]|nr:hypothetical protein [Paludibacteraceae bacterium]
MDKLLCSKLSLEYFSKKYNAANYADFAINKFEYKTCEVQVAVFKDDFNEPPVIETLEVKLSDKEYLLLLQWQLQNPKTGANACYEDASSVMMEIEWQVEEKIFGDEEIGTYVIYLSEIRRDVDLILQEMELNK